MATRKQYSKEFKLDAISLVLEQGYSRSEAARSLDINPNVLGRWIKEHESADGQAFRGNGKLTPEQAEIRQLREENRRLKMEKDNLKKRRSSLPKKRVEVRVHYPAQEDLASRRHEPTLGCQSQCLLSVLPTSTGQAAGFRARGDDCGREGRRQKQQIQLRFPTDEARPERPGLPSRSAQGAVADARGRR